MKIQFLQVGDLGTNCYILCDEVENVCAVVDPGGDPEQIQAAVEQIGCTPCAIMLTHGHHDHTDGVVGLQAAWPEVTTYINSRDNSQNNPGMRGMCPRLPDVTDYDEGDTIQVGSLTVTVMATPGHTEGGVTLRCEDVLFTGDTLFAGSMGRTDFPGGDEKKIMASLKRLGELEGNLAVLPGHMGFSDLNQERQRNPYLRMAMNTK